MSQLRVTKPAHVDKEVVEAQPAAKAEPADFEYTDELLDEIDGVLEENAEAFVKQYVQKGGE